MDVDLRHFSFIKLIFYDDCPEYRVKDRATIAFVFTKICSKQ